MVISSTSKHKSILFLTLKVFSATGGIEKVCRVAGKAFSEICEEMGGNLRLMSMHDEEKEADDNKYFDTLFFHGYNANKPLFAVASFFSAFRHGVIVLSHVNLLPIGWIIKKLLPSRQLILIAHGIEVWKPVSWLRRNMLKDCDQVWAVSKFTRGKLINVHGLDVRRVKVLNNCIDPFLTRRSQLAREISRENRGFGLNDPVMLTLTRLAPTERHKGYDRMIGLVKRLLPEFPNLRYLIAGEVQSAERTFIENLVAEQGLEDHITLMGYIPDMIIDVVFNMADLYVMPSKKEGFGIVFIEAMFYGLPVIAGNADGSADALLDGKLGTLVDPDDDEKIAEAVRIILGNKKQFKPDPVLLQEHFGYRAYRKNITRLLHPYAPLIERGMS